MDQDIRQLVSGLPEVLETIDIILDPPPQYSQVYVTDMMRASAVMIRKEVCDSVSRAQRVGCCFCKV